MSVDCNVDGDVSGTIGGARFEYADNQRFEKSQLIPWSTSRAETARVPRLRTPRPNCDKKSSGFLKITVGPGKGPATGSARFTFTDHLGQSFVRNPEGATTQRIGSSEQLMGEIVCVCVEKRRAPRESEQQCLVFVTRFCEVVRLLSPFHPSRPCAAPGGEPRRMKGRRSLHSSISQGRIASRGGSELDEFGSLSNWNRCPQDATKNYLQSRDGLQAVCSGTRRISRVWVATDNRGLYACSWEWLADVFDLW